MKTILDLIFHIRHDPTGIKQGLHPRDKQQIADRLWLGALQIAYNLTQNERFQAPIPTHVILTQDDHIAVGFDNFEANLEFRDIQGTKFEVTFD